MASCCPTSSRCGTGTANIWNIVAHGNEHVIRARFSDASYFYKEDLKKPLEDYLPRLATLTFQKNLGSMLDKNERVAELVEPLGKLLHLHSTDEVIAQRAAHVVKADLATRMVVEMTALQGIMGREYALKGDYPPEVADAIFEHWLPRSADDMLPTSPAGTLLALADRLDSLVGLFGVGLAPKSTADPYGLRRAALGIIQILVQKEIDLSLGKAVELTIQVQPVRVQANTKDDVLDFIAGRLRAWVEEQEWPRDVIAAVLAEQSANPYRAMVGIRQLSEWVQSAKLGANTGWLRPLCAYHARLSRSGTVLTRICSPRGRRNICTRSIARRCPIWKLRAT